MAICSVQAQDEVQPQPKKSILQKVVHYLDSSNVMGTDPDYIGLPEKIYLLKSYSIGRVITNRLPLL